MSYSPDSADLQITQATTAYLTYLKNLAKNDPANWNSYDSQNLLFNVMLSESLPVSLNEHTHKALKIAVGSPGHLNHDSALLIRIALEYQETDLNGSENPIGDLTFAKTTTGHSMMLAKLLANRANHEEKLLQNLLAQTLMETSGDKNISTIQVLESVFFILSFGLYGEYKKEVHYHLHKLLKKFEVTGKLYETYGPMYAKTKKPEKYSDSGQYALLNASLLILYDRTRDFKALNCALKLNDTLMHILNKGEMPKLMPLYIWSMKENKRLTGRLYDTH